MTTVALIISIVGGIVGGLLSLVLSSKLSKTPAILLTTILVIVGYLAATAINLSGIAKPSTPDSSSTTDWSGTVSALEQTNPRLALMRNKDPQTYSSFKRDIIKLLEAGNTPEQISAVLPGSIELAARKKLPGALDVLVLREIEIIRDTFETLKSTAPRACLPLLNGQQVPNLARALPEPLLIRKSTQVNDLIQSAPQDGAVMMTGEAYSGIHENIREQLTETYGEFEAPSSEAGQTDEDALETCDRGRDYFQAVLELPPETRVPFSRKMLSQ